MKPETPPVVCLGEAIIDFLPANPRQNLRQAGRLRRLAGGAPANVTAGLVKLGVPAAFLGKVGADPFGYFLRDSLVAAGVDVSHMLFAPEANTGLAFAWTEDATGEARYLFYRGSSAYRELRPDELDREWLGAAQIFQFGSLLLAAEPGASATWTALETAQKAGSLRVYDLNLRLPAWPDPASARRGMLEPLSASDIVKLNRHELAFLTGEADLERGVKQLWRDHYRLLVVTLDREGCYFRTKKGDGRLPGYAVSVVDTVGCGDAFMAALLAGILKQPAGKHAKEFDFDNPDLTREICRYANAAGALTATRPGALPALPGKTRLARFLKNPPGNQQPPGERK